MLHRGEPMRRVLRSMCGDDDSGRMWAERIMATLEAFACHRTRRKALELLLRTLEGARMHGSQWRVIDRAGWVGQRTEIAPALVYDYETGEVLEHPTKTRRRHVPKRRARGLADRMDRSPRQLDRYRRVLRAGRVLRSQRTTRNMGAVVLPHGDAFFGFAQTWLAFPPSTEMVRRFTGWSAPRQSGVMTSARASAANQPRLSDLDQSPAHAPGALPA